MIELERVERGGAGWVELVWVGGFSCLIVGF